MMEEELPERSEHLEKRNFHLALSITNGQALAHLAGYAIPSEDVQKHEIMDIIHKWLSLHTLGIIDEVHKCVDWIVETTSKVNKFTDQQEKDSAVFLTSFAIASLIHLFDSQHIDYTNMTDDTTEQSQDFIKKTLLGDL